MPDSLVSHVIIAAVGFALGFAAAHLVPDLIAELRGRDSHVPLSRWSSGAKGRAHVYPCDDGTVPHYPATVLPLKTRKRRV